MKQSLTRRAALPAVGLGVILLAVSLVTYNSLLRDEKGDLCAVTELTAHHLVRRLQWWGEARIESMWQLTRVAPPLQNHSTASFQETAQQLLDTYPGMQALNWVDRDWTIRLINPVEGNEAALGKNLQTHPDPAVHATIAQVKQTGKLGVSHPAHLYQGGVGVAVYLPTYDHGGNLVGYVNGVFRVDSLVEHSLSEEEVTRSFNFSVCGPDNQLLYLEGDSLQHADPTLRVTQPVWLFGQEWRLTIAPNERYIREYHSNAATLFLVVSLTITLFAPFTLFLLLKRQAKLRLNESRYRSLFEGSKDAIYRSTLDGRVLNANRAMCELLGYTNEEFETLNSLQLYSDSEVRKKLLAELEDKGVIRDFPVQLRDKGGKDHSCLITASLETDPVSEETVIQGIIRDITEQVELEERFHQAQKMEALGRLAGGISHDFNNLLTAILGQVELARYSIREGGDSMEHIDSIGETAGRASELTRRLLAFSRKQTVRLRPLRLDEAIDNMKSLFSSLLGEDINLEINLVSDCPQIEADPSQIEQVLMNLVVNARDAMPEGGTLTIELNCYSPPVLRDEDAYVRLRVKDTGVGMPPEVRARVFEPYFTTKGETKGTGLGLATVFGIVEQLGGHIHVESQQGIGTTFEIVFPRYQGFQEEGNSSLGVAVQPQRGNERILLVEDDPVVLSTTLGLLSNLGYEVIGANGPHEGLRLLKEEQFEVDLLITDVVMPEMSGADLVGKIRKFNGKLPVLYISGHTQDVVLARTHDETVHFLQKPFELHTFADAIRATLEGRSND